MVLVSEILGIWVLSFSFSQILNTTTNHHHNLCVLLTGLLSWLSVSVVLAEGGVHTFTGFLTSSLSVVVGPWAWLWPHTRLGLGLCRDSVGFYISHHLSYLALHHLTAVVHHLGPDVVQEPTASLGVCTGCLMMLITRERLFYLE